MRGVSGVAMLSNQFYERWDDASSSNRSPSLFFARGFRLIGETDRPPKILCLAVARPLGSL